MAAELGYSNVYAFRDGLPAWIKAGYPVKSIEKLPRADVENITATDLQQMVNKGEDFLLLDIRLPSLALERWIEFPRRVNVPLDDLQDQLGTLPANKKVVIVDAIGKRTSVAGRYLKLKGYKDVAKMMGGMDKWAKDGLPVASR